MGTTFFVTDTGTLEVSVNGTPASADITWAYVEHHTMEQGDAHV